ncbi:unnamed protein product [Allacma fusca]|uniref:Uncharacterized protein n=1 Tax=Allacma fusca TaxID=39272 RepID=A0A8J2K3S5_9HEXA|nr:unnamed protein product [Allacma fusca]
MVSPQEVTKDHGFVIKNLVEATLIDYLNAIESVVGAENIVDIGRVTSNYGIWVKNDEAAQKLKLLEFLTIRNQSVSIWPYVEPLKKVKLMGVPPFLDNKLLKLELNKYGMVKSEIESEPIYGVPEKFKHIKSFTRTVYMTFQKDVLLPDSLLIQFEDKKHAIKTQVGRRKCFFCGSFSHIGSNCMMRKAISYANATKTQDNAYDTQSDTHENVDFSSITQNLPQDTVMIPLLSKKTFRAEAASTDDGNLTDASQTKRRKKAGPHVIRNIKTRSLYDWKYEEWKYLELNKGKPCKNSELKEFLQSIPTDRYREPMYVSTVAKSMNKDLTQLKTQLHELKQAFSPKHTYDKTNLQKIIDHLTITLQTEPSNDT